MLYSLDSWLIATLERAAHRFQILTGKTNFWVAGKILQLLTILMAGVLGWDIWEGPRHNLQAIVSNRQVHEDLCLLFIILCFTVQGLLAWKRAEQAALVRLSRGVANPAKTDRIAQWFRIFMAMLWIIGGMIIMYDAFRHWLTGPLLLCCLMLTLLLLEMVLKTCDPLQPCRGKIQQWLAAFIKRFSPV